MKRLFLTAAIALTMGSAAIAADIYEPPPAAPAPEYGAGDWTGFYVGGHTGYAWGKPKDGAFCDNGPGSFWVLVLEPGGAADLASCEWSDAVIAGASLDPDLQPGYNMIYYDVDPFKGWLGGVQVGYTLQYGAFVMGAEVNGSLSKINSGRIGTGIGGDFTGDYDINWILTATSKLGFAMGRFMVYGEGGMALLGTSVSSSLGVSDDETALGWTAGGGVEVMLADGISAFAKYNFIRAEGVEHSGQTYLIFPTYFISDIDLNVVQVGFNKRL